AHGGGGRTREICGDHRVPTGRQGRERQWKRCPLHDRQRSTLRLTRFASNRNDPGAQLSRRPGFDGGMVRSALWFWLLASLVVACRGDGPQAGGPAGGSPPSTQVGTPTEVAVSGPLFDVRSGSKLKVRWLVGEGGARLFDGFEEPLGRCSFSLIKGRTLC